MLIRVDPALPTPLFEQLANSIRQQIAAGLLPASSRLPSARTLAEQLSLNLHTALRGYQILRDEGLIELRPGRGAVVTKNSINDPALAELLSAVALRSAELGISENLLIALLREARSKL